MVDPTFVMWTPQFQKQILLKVKHDGSNFCHVDSGGLTLVHPIEKEKVPKIGSCW